MDNSEIKKLREGGYSYSEIAKRINKNKKFVWRKSHNIQFSKDGRERYQKNVKGIIKKIKTQENSLSLRKIRIIGHVLFDGCSYSKNYRHVVKYINSSKGLIDQFIEDIKDLYGLNPTSLEVEEKPHITLYRLTFVSKLLFEDLRKYFLSYSSKDCSKIPEEIMNGSKEIKIEFLRAFWEDEGSISMIGRLTADQKDENIINQISQLHNEFGFDFKICKYREPTGFMYKIYFLKNKVNLLKFLDLNLFDKSIVTRGKNIGRLKKEVLYEIVNKKRDSTSASHLVRH